MFDDKEKIILRELIKNPRVSDNQIAKNTGIPVMTVNRKRKRLEENNKLIYFTYVNYSSEDFRSNQLYIIKFKSGITKSLYMNKIQNDRKFKEVYSKYVGYSFLGEKDGHLALIMIINALNDSELVEIFNGLIVKSIKMNFGDDAIVEIITSRISLPLRLHHNYIPLMNIDKSVIKKNWSDDYIFVERKKELFNPQQFLSDF